MTVPRHDLEIATHEILSDLKLVDDATEKDFIFAALVTSVEACKSEEFSHVTAGSVLEEAFRQRIHPAITTSPARSRRRIIELVAHFDENGLIDTNLGRESFLTDKGAAYLGRIGLGGDSSIITAK